MLRSATRREFLATTSLALAGTTLGARGLHAQRIPVRLGATPVTAHGVLPVAMPASELRMLATTAMEAATRGGASYADIRLGESQGLNVMLDPGAIDGGVIIQATFSFGLRVLVDGVWAFTHGRSPTPDAVSKAARDAVVTARSYAKLTTQRTELAPVPVVTGEWEVPCALDPFMVPLQDQSALLGAYQQAAGRVRYGVINTSLRWSRETRVVASSEGTLVTQTLRQADPWVRVSGIIGPGFGSASYNMFPGGAGGYELVAVPGAQDEIVRQTEECVRLAWYPMRPLDVGRYPVVFDGMMLGSVVGRTLGPALEADRALGYEADGAGTSFLSPPTELLGSTIASPLLNVTANRTAPLISAAKWDDEGVETHEYPVIANGRLVDYHTSRETAAELRPAYAKHNLLARSHGSAQAYKADDPVMVRAPHLTVHPATTSANLEELYKDMAHGLLVIGDADIATDHQCVSGSYAGDRNAAIFEIERGKIVRHVRDAGLQFNTQPLFKGLLALGDTRTMRETPLYYTFKGMPWRWGMSGTRAPAGLFKEVNVISTGLRI